jgi:hypothetical protein
MGMQVTGRLVGIVAVGALLLGACGDDGSDEEEAAVEGPTMDNSEETLISYVEEFQEGSLVDADADTYPTLSAECQAKWTPSDWEANAGAWRSAIEQNTNLSAEELQIDRVEVQEIDEDSATVVVTWADASGTVLDGLGGPAEWVYEDGGWRTASCPSLAEALAGE